jgi:hypothetical protein
MLVHEESRTSSILVKDRLIRGYIEGLMELYAEDKISKLVFRNCIDQILDLKDEDSTKGKEKEKKEGN